MTNVDFHLFRTRDGKWRVRVQRSALPRGARARFTFAGKWAYTCEFSTPFDALQLVSLWVEP